MKVLFDLTPVYDHLTGIERYSINISYELIKSHPENEYVLLFKNEIHEAFREISANDNVSAIVLPACNKLVFIQWKLYRALRKITADYYVFLGFTSPVLFSNQHIINTIHDLTCWDCAETIPVKMKYYYRIAYYFAIKKSWKILTVSCFSRDRICSKYNVSCEDVSVVYDGLSDLFAHKYEYTDEMCKKYKIPKEYILSLSTIEPRKNLELLIKAYKEIITEDANIPDLVLVGRKGWKQESITRLLTDDIQDRIHFTGFVDDCDLPYIYRKALVFIFPSKYEGFGLPVIEAMSQGTFVISSNAASLPEIMENSGIMFESENVNELITAIKRFLNLTDEEKNENEMRGIQICKKYSWRREAEKLFSIINESHTTSVR